MAAGIAPIPSWSVAPSGMRSAMNAADPPLDLADLRPARTRTGGWSTSHGEVDLADVDERLAQRPRHRRVELHDDGLRGADRRVHRLDRHAQRAEAVGVGRAHVDEHRVERQRARA